MADAAAREDLVRSRLFVPALPIMVVVVGLLATLAGGLLIERLGEARERQRFEALVDQANDAIAARLDTYVAILQAGAGLFAASDEVTHSEFKAFARRVELRERYPGIQGIGYSARIEEGEEGAFVARQHAAGRDDYAISRRDDPQADERHAILYLEPEDERNRAAIGFDMYSEPTRREAMARARDTGGPAMSGKVELVQEIDEKKQAGFLIYEPIYAGDVAPATVEARRASLEGFLYAPFRAGDLLEAVFDSIDDKPYRYAVYYGEPAPENLLFRSSGGSPEGGYGLRAVRHVEVAGARWTAVYRAGPGFTGGAARQLTWAFLIAGIVATLLVAAATWWQGQARMAAEREVAARKRIEARQKLLMDELNHRVKNTLATVQSIAAQSLRQASDVESVRRNFEARLIALAQAHNLLTRDNWRGASLGELVATEFSPYLEEASGRLDADGPPVWLAPNTAVALGMAIHELTTNAVKYGALSTAAGRVLLRWELEEIDPETDRLSILWREEGGPAVTPPSRKGFGSRLIVGGLAHQLDGEVRLDFPTDGVQCEIVFRVPRSPDPAMLPVGEAAG
ncbi:MAG: CHASE domain-containing protein [Pseudomonadota bacterium]